MALTPQQSMLQGLAGSMPVANEQIAARQKAARDLQLLQAVQKAPAGGAIIPTAQQTGAAMAASAGQDQIQRIQNAAQAQDQISQIGQNVQALELQKQGAEFQSGLKEQQMTDAQRLASISEDAKAEVFDTRMQFQRDRNQQEFLNQVQLSDYAVLRAKTEEDWQNYVQRTEQLAARKEMTLKFAYQKLSQQLQFENQQINQLRDQLTKKGITEREAATKREILNKKLQLDLQLKGQLAALQAAQQRAASREARRKAKNAAKGQIIGSVIGGVLGSEAGPAGAAAGAGAGGQIGSGLGALV
jgi:hypothetical protein